ncbi:MAG: amino acid ABC transporter substrate-binding protein [Candidatus Taylorbacteria bacterium]|nr:amino acid ABC transporter substrate-binding protein [Candidatus Taylorbacteria bacterium]
MNKIKYIIIATILVLIAVSTMHTKETKEARLGAVFHSTGFASFVGEESRNGLLLALKDTGFPAERVVIEDGKSDVTGSVNAVNKLVHVDKVQAIIGPEWTEFGAAVAPIASTNKIPIISPWVVADSDFVKPPYFWSMTPSDLGEHKALAQYMKKKSVKKVAVIKTVNTWSNINAKQITTELANLGIEYIEISTNPDQTDFRTEILKVKEYKPDYAYSAISDDMGHAALCNQVLAQIGDIMIATHSARAKAKSTLDNLGRFKSKVVFAEMHSGNKQDEFNEKYKAIYGKYPSGPSAAATYDAAVILIKGLASNLSTVESISQANYEGYSGYIRFDSKGKLPLRNASVFTFDESGKQVPLFN